MDDSTALRLEAVACVCIRRTIKWVQVCLVGVKRDLDDQVASFSVLAVSVVNKASTIRAKPIRQGSTVDAIGWIISYNHYR